MGRFVVANFSEGIGIYLLIALTSYAFSYYRRYREGQAYDWAPAGVPEGRAGAGGNAAAPRNPVEAETPA